MNQPKKPDFNKSIAASALIISTMLLIPSAMAETFTFNAYDFKTHGRDVVVRNATIKVDRIVIDNEKRTLTVIGPGTEFSVRSNALRNYRPPASGKIFDKDTPLMSGAGGIQGHITVNGIKYNNVNLHDEKILIHHGDHLMVWAAWESKPNASERIGDFNGRANKYTPPSPPPPGTTSTGSGGDSSSRTSSSGTSSSGTGSSGTTSSGTSSSGVPAPGMIALFGLGLAGLAGQRRRRKAKK